jgi:Fem-1 family protein b
VFFFTTAFIRESMEEFDILLLSAVHQGDITLLKTHLLTVADPNVYLNRLYDKPNEQKCTLLTIACLNGYDDIVYMLLNCFKPDLEVLNVIQINDEDEEPEIYKNVTALWVAAAIDHFSIVKRLVKCGANVNHTTDMNSTPTRCACSSGNVEMTRYLVENGADIHITKKNNETNLSLSVYREHLKMTVYLVDELGCDVNECDGDGFSPLYFTVKCGSLEIAQFLLDRGARNFPATCNRLSPLMFAAEQRRPYLMDAISPYCPLHESIEAEELLGSSFACGEHGNCNLEKVFEHFLRALELRSTHNLLKTLRSTTIEIFNNRQECQTVDQLKELRSNSENMYIEALLVRERLLGPTSEKYQYSVIYRGAVLADNAEYDRAVALWLYELELHQQYSIAIDPKHLRQFPSIYSEMVYKSSPISIEGILIVTKAILGELKNNTEGFDDNLHTLLYLTTIVSQVGLLEDFFCLLSDFRAAIGGSTLFSC